MIWVLLGTLIGTLAAMLVWEFRHDILAGIRKGLSFSHSWPSARDKGFGRPKTPPAANGDTGASQPPEGAPEKPNPYRRRKP